MKNQKGASARQTIRYLRESSFWDFVKFTATQRWPILDTRLRYRNLWGSWSHIAAMDIFLLVCSGYTRGQIARWLRVSLDTINGMTRKLKQAGVPIRRASRPEKNTSMIPERPSAQELRETQRVEEIMANVRCLIKRYEMTRQEGIKEWLLLVIDYELSRLHQQRDLKFELRTAVQRYRPMTEETFDALILAKKKRECGGKVGGGPQSANEDETLSFNLAYRRTSSPGGRPSGALKNDYGLLMRYRTGKWFYKAYQYGRYPTYPHISSRPA